MKKYYEDKIDYEIFNKESNLYHNKKQDERFLEYINNKFNHDVFLKYYLNGCNNPFIDNNFKLNSNDLSTLEYVDERISLYKNINTLIFSKKINKSYYERLKYFQNLNMKKIKCNTYDLDIIHEYFSKITSISIWHNTDLSHKNLSFDKIRKLTIVYFGSFKGNEKVFPNVEELDVSLIYALHKKHTVNLDATVESENIRHIKIDAFKYRDNIINLDFLLEMKNLKSIKISQGYEYFDKVLKIKLEEKGILLQ